METINKEWVYSNLPRWGLDRRDSELDLGEFYRTPHDHPAGASAGFPRPFDPRHLASVRRYLPHEHGDALSFAHNLLLGLLDRIFPPQIGSARAEWPLSLSVLHCPYFEWLLHTETDYPAYRDHMFHSLWVAAVGRWLIDQCKWASRCRDKQTSARGKLARAAAESPQVERLLSELNLRESALTDRILLAAWWIAALFHDIGYSVYLIGQLEKKIEEALPWYAGDMAAGIVRGCRPETIQRSLFVDYLTRHDVLPPSWSGRRKPWEVGLYRDCFGNHSVIGAVILLMSLDETKQVAGHVRPELDLIFHLAAEAIFYHDLLPSKQLEDAAQARCAIIWAPGSDSERPMHTAHTPLGALLAFCDRLHEQDRLKLAPHPMADGCKALKPLHDTNGDIKLGVTCDDTSAPTIATHACEGMDTLRWLVNEELLGFDGALELTWS